jgi:hypothetical protein
MRPGKLATLVAVPFALLTGVLVFWLMGGLPKAKNEAKEAAKPQATGTVSVTPPSLDARGTEVCRALIAKLPNSVRDRDRRPVSAGTEQSAAYGDPAIVVSCGGTQPSFAPDAQLVGLSGVCWYQDQQAWVTAYREVPIRVNLPASYQQPGQWIVDFSQPIVETVPLAAGVSDDAAQICAPPAR